MKKTIILNILLIYLLNVCAQTKDNPVLVKFGLSSNEYIDYFEHYFEYGYSERYLKIVLDKPTDLLIDNQGSSGDYSKLQLLDKDYKLYSPKSIYDGYTFTPQHLSVFASIEEKNVPAGTYYIHHYSGMYFSSENMDFYLQNLKFKLVTRIRKNTPQIRENTSPFPKLEQLSKLGENNYTITIAPQSETSYIKYENNKLESESTKEHIIEMECYDGLGRAIQTLHKGASPSKKDIVSIREYDSRSRNDKTWLPTSISNAGTFIDISIVKTSIINFYNDSKPYSLSIYDYTPINDISEIYMPGQDWHNNKKSLKTGYTTNTSSGLFCCHKYEVVGEGTTCTLKKTGDYPAEKLLIIENKDEDGNTTYSFKNFQGETILTRQINNGQYHDTYYVYDIRGNQCYVLPPLAVDKLTSFSDNDTNLKQLAYIYKYDNKNRCISKKIPGCDPTYYVYDKADRLIFSQDGEQRLKGEWSFSFPDVFGRTVITGICKTVNSAAITQGRFDKWIIRAEFSKTGTFKGYNIQVGTTTFNPLTVENATVYTVNYFDNYDFMGINGIPAITDAHMKPEIINGYGTQYTGGFKGLLTGILTGQQLSNGTISPSYLYSVMYYDDKGKLIQCKSNNHLAGGIEKEYYAYNFSGQPVKKMHIHMATGKTTQTEYYTYEYDHVGRLLETKHKLNTGADIVLAENTYDEVGRLKTNKKANNVNLNTTYDYNVRSWIKSISGPQFTQNLYYNQSYGQSKPQYNGNISAFSWKVSTGGTTLGYAFSYDNLSRLTAASYLTNSSVYNGGYKVQNISYDKNGNIKTLQRYGNKTASTYDLVDNLTMTYTGNQLTKAEDLIPTINLSGSADFKNYSNTAVEYTYNRNGSMTKDMNKGISSIQYNFLNLPSQIDIKSPVAEARNEYTYSASGQKLKIIQKWNPNYSTTPIIGSTINTSSLSQSRTTEYIGNKIYENGALKRILIDGGYIESGIYHFFMTDHLGNNRVIAKADGSLVQLTHYYPFGSSFAVATGSDKQPYKYNNKELDQMHGLNMYDYSARYYEADKGRFSMVDPHAENYYSWSPYVYAANNPILNIDPDGMDYWSTNDFGEIFKFENGYNHMEFDRTKWTNHGMFHEEVSGLLWLNDFDLTTGLRYFRQGGLASYKKDLFWNPFDLYDTRIELEAQKARDPLDVELNGPLDKASGQLVPRYDEFTILMVARFGPLAMSRSLWDIYSTASRPAPGAENTVRNGFGGKNKEKMGVSKGNMSGNRVVQKEQFNTLANKYRLSKAQRKELHKLISGQGYGYHEVEKIILDFIIK